MTWVAQPAQSTGDVVSAAMWNRQKDNDLFVARDRPFCMAAMSVNQTIANNANTVLSFDTNYVDNASVHSTSVNPSRFTAPIAGWYGGWVQTAWEADVDGLRVTRWLINGALGLLGEDSRLGFGLFTCAQQVNVVWPLNAGDYLEVQVYHAAGNDLAVLAPSHVFIDYLRP